MRVCCRIWEERYQVYNVIARHRARHGVEGVLIDGEYQNLNA